MYVRVITDRGSVVAVRGYAARMRAGMIHTSREFAGCSLLPSIPTEMDVPPACPVEDAP
jgi:hypothetical protein